MKENGKKTTTIEKQTKAERTKGNRSYNESVQTKWFCCAFKLGFPHQLICKAFLICQLNLELVLSIILKQRECNCWESWCLISEMFFPKKFSVSYDVSSLFTNIPLQKTIDIGINLIFNHNPNVNITRTELKKLFLFATSQTHYIFNSTFYNQIDGVAMGSSLAPVLTNIFMGFHEPKWLNEYNLNKPKF